MRRASIVIAAITMLGLTASTGLWFWLDSSAGRQWVSDSVHTLSHGSVTIRGLSGHPLSQATADAVLLTSPTLAMTAETVILDWSPWRLLSGKLSIATLDSDKVHLRMIEAAQANDDSPATLPAITIGLESMHVGELIVEKSDSSTTRLTDIRIERANFGTTLSGALQARLPDADLKLHVVGSMADWKLDGHLIRGNNLKRDDTNTLDITLAGHFLNSGKAELAMISGDTDGHLEARWQYDNSTLKASGTLITQAGTSKLTGDWTLSTPTDFSQVNLNMRTAAMSPLLIRSIPLDISASLNESGLSAVIEERGASLKLHLTYKQAQLEGEMTLAEWISPLKNAVGRLSGRIHGSWQQDNQTWQLHGDIDKGELAGLIARLKIDGEGDAAHWKIHRADLRALGLILKASGQGDHDQFTASGELAGKSITPALTFAGLAQASGSLTADIKLQGSYKDPHLQLTAKTAGISLESIHIDTLTLSAQHNLTHGSAQLTATGMSVSGRREMKRLSVTSNLKSNQLSVSMASQGRLQSRAKVQVDISDLEHLDFAITGADLNYASARLLKADKLVLHIDGPNILLSDADLHILDAKAKAAFAITNGQVKGTLHMAGLIISGNEPWLSGMKYHLSGKGDLSLELAGQSTSPTAQFHLTAPAFNIKHAMFTGKNGRALTLADVSLKLDYQQPWLAWQLNAKASAEGSLASHGRFSMRFSMQPWQLELPEQLNGSGSLALKLARLSDFQPLLPRIDPFEGKANLDLSWSMPMRLSAISGNSNISFDALGIPEFGLDMKGDINTTITEGKPHTDLRLHSGSGELSMRGLIDINKRTIPEIRFNQFSLIDLPDQQLAVSGTIATSEQQDISIIKGDLEVTRMRLEIPDPVPGPTTDLQWPDETKMVTSNKKTPLTKIDLNLVLNDDSEIYGRGMQLKPKGRLHLGSSLSQPLLTGVLDLASGKIEFRSVKLDIQPGSRVVFSGDPKRPSIHVIAARKIGDISAGVIVDGPADQLNSQLFSDPAMSNAEIFSYIATGRPLASLGSDTVSDLMTASEFILGPGTMMQEVQGKVKQVTGLDVFEIGGDTSGGKLKAGRRLSEEMTLTVEQTISKEPSSALTLEYMLTKSVSLFARQALDMAPKVGLRYSKEWFGSPKKTTARGITP
ncbi:DUF490 domain-containing protein [Mariprofundus sp. EBB-1]|uniref:translocation/assembly module TamB domain-containing protein n=1 Tax=Mariprofundus sp. EBB-1 TaxID=2650971 RepID=UPI000EF176AC|nr:translocation/assembly module TamB domain-containing protein [Mariprofundus sp. EBB-1]RLL51964.1 DUF490 domain-containing protein [Mariprofundus sp. EBB-1]